LLLLSALIFIAPSFLYLIPKLPRLIETRDNPGQIVMADALILRCLSCGSRTTRTELPHRKAYQTWLITRLCLKCCTKYHVCRGVTCSLQLNRHHPQVAKVFTKDAQLRNHHYRYHVPPPLPPPCVGLDQVQPNEGAVDQQM
jgi:hypothetical protein